MGPNGMFRCSIQYTEVYRVYSAVYLQKYMAGHELGLICKEGADMIWTILLIYEHSLYNISSTVSVLRLLSADIRPSIMQEAGKWICSA
jgi:hypothetical protein